MNKSNQKSFSMERNRARDFKLNTQNYLSKPEFSIEEYRSYEISNTTSSTISPQSNLSLVNIDEKNKNINNQNHPGNNNNF